MTFKAESIAFDAWPDPRDALTLDWEEIPRRYRAGDDPDEVLTLYRATTAGQTEYGMLSNAFRLFGFDAARHAQALAHAPSAEIAGQIDRFTSSSELSPFLPAAWDRERTASWAKDNREVYELRLPARRVLVDGDNTGTLREALILGAVLPHEIVGGPDASGYPETWRELADAWRIQQDLERRPEGRLGLHVTTFGAGAGVELRASSQPGDETCAQKWQAKIDALGADAFVDAARRSKHRKRQLVTVGEGADAVVLLFVRHRRGAFARSDADANFFFRVVPPDLLAA